MIKVISFDLDGTLVDHSFADAVWLEGIVALYSRKKGIDFEEAKREIIDRYQEVGEHSVEWYALAYWFRILNLEGSPRDLLEKHKDKVRLFDDTKEVLAELSKRYRLILFSNG